MWANSKYHDTNIEAYNHSVQSSPWISIGQLSWFGLQADNTQVYCYGKSNKGVKNWSYVQNLFLKGSGPLSFQGNKRNSCWWFWQGSKWSVRNRNVELFVQTNISDWLKLQMVWSIHPYWMTSFIICSCFFFECFIVMKKVSNLDPKKEPKNGSGQIWCSKFVPIWNAIPRNKPHKKHKCIWKLKKFSL